MFLISKNLINFFIIFFIIICFSKYSYSNHEPNHSFEENALGISELDCYTETTDAGATISQCNLKEINFENISFTQNEKNALKCWSNKPLGGGESLFTLEFYFTLNLDNKNMRLEYYGYAENNSEMLIEEVNLDMESLYHLYDNKHKTMQVTDSGMMIDLKFNYPNIIYDSVEIIETKLTFTDGNTLDVELNCAASPFLVAQFPSISPQNIEPPLMAQYLEPGDIKMDNINYHALIIGINNYDSSIGELDTAINDAKALDNILTKKYGFKTKTLVDADATRDQIIDALDYYIENLTTNDNLLIYFAGHGKLDKGDDKASYWLPFDAKYDSKSRWISNLELSSRIKSLKSKHVLVIADSCYAGAQDRGGIDFHQNEDAKIYFKRILTKQSRKLLASGGEEPVMDSGGGEHSVFAKALLDILKENNTYLETYSLFGKLRPKVINNSPQTPEYEIIWMAGDDGGEFIFVPKS